MFVMWLKNFGLLVWVIGLGGIAMFGLVSLIGDAVTEFGLPIVSVVLSVLMLAVLSWVLTKPPKSHQ